MKLLFFDLETTGTNPARDAYHIMIDGSDE